MMMKTIFLAFLLLVVGQGVVGLVQLPFESSNGDRLKTWISIGTPAQNFPVSVKTNGLYRGILVPTKTKKSWGIRVTDSTTFKFVDNRRHEGRFIGFNGLDRIQILDSKLNVQQTFSNKSFSVMDVDWPVPFGDFAYLGLIRKGKNGEEDQQTFLDDIFGQSKEAIAVYTYDDINANKDFTGQVTLGERPSNCKSQWTQLPEMTSTNEFYNQWNFQLDSFRAGQFSYNNKLQATFSTEYSDMLLPYGVFTSFLKEFNYKSGFVPCNTQTVIEFSLGGLKLVLSPDDYMKKTANNGPNEFCKFLVEQGVDGQIRLPNTLLKNRCLLMDFKNNRIELTDRRGKNDDGKSHGDSSSNGIRMENVNVFHLILVVSMIIILWK